jgi:polar amino acid transport system substrate-binding protein
VVACGVSASDSRLSVVGYAAVTHKGRDAAAKYLSEFVEDIKTSGLVARVIEKNGIRGVSVAPMAAAK